jgi:two-component system cell cycle response regulator DivK
LVGVRGRCTLHIVESPALILVVDDTEDNRAVLRMCVEDAGYRVAEAVDGLDALAHIERERPALVLMDLSMPVMDGWEATRRIKANPATRDIPVLVISGHATTDEGVTRAREAGADDIAMKPCRSEELLAKVRRLLG